MPKPEKINDTLRTNDAGGRTGPFHVLAAARLSDTVMFQQLIDRGELPSSAYVAAVFGSTWIRQHTHPKDPTGVASILAATKASLPQNDWSSDQTPLYDAYLNVLAGLFEPADPDAPAFMAGDAWAAKSCQTALAGWAQMRHTFTLQTKLAVSTLGVSELPPGFIEPAPAFFRRFVEFLGQARASLASAGAFERSGASVAAGLLSRAELLQTLAAEVRSSLQKGDTKSWRDSRTHAVYENYICYGQMADPLPDSLITRLGELHRLESESDSSTWITKLDECAAALRAYAARLETGEPPLLPTRRDDLHSLARRWIELQNLATRLEPLLQKQLRQRDWNAEEGRFIKNYGSQLAYIMGYFGSDYFPQDDAPRWAEIVRDAPRDESFAAATGRPTSFYVLYPWHGIEILCTGAVIPFYEDRSKERLTDTEWRAKLDRTPPPAPPEWLDDIHEPRPAGAPGK